MRKQATPKLFNFVKKTAGIIFAAEVGAFGLCYYVYHRMNTDRDYRLYLRDNYSFALESFYSIGEFMNANDQTRKVDDMIWRQTGQEQKKE